MVQAVQNRARRPGPRRPGRQPDRRSRQPHFAGARSESHGTNLMPARPVRYRRHGSLPNALLKESRLAKGTFNSFGPRNSPV